MAAYVIIDVEVTDEALYAQYREQVTSLIAAHGGRRIAYTAEAEVVDGGWTPRRLALLEFPNAEQARDLASSLESAELQAARAHCVGSRNVVVFTGL